LKSKDYSLVFTFSELLRKEAKKTLMKEKIKQKKYKEEKSDIFFAFAIYEHQNCYYF
jgi:hypothetical protein